MSDYAIPFSDKLLEDDDFDTIFGAHEDDQLMHSVMKEADIDFDDDSRLFNGIEDKTGKIGGGSGLGSDLGPGHDSKGAESPEDDSSDEKNLIDQIDTVDQDEVIDAAKADPTQKSANICDRHIEDSTDKLTNNVNSFEDTYSKLLKEFEDMSYDEEVPPVGPDTENDGANGDMIAQLDAEEDNSEEAEQDSLVNALMGEDVDVAEERNNSGINDNNLDNLGDDLGPDHDSKGGEAPEDDSSDEDIIAAISGEELKSDQLSTGDNAQGNIKDGGQISGGEVDGDCRSAAACGYDENADIIAALEGVDLEDEDTTEEEEDELIDAAEDNGSDVEMKYTVDELNDDEDDDIMDAVLGGRD